MGIAKDFLQFAGYPIVLLLGYIINDRRSKGSQKIAERQAAAAEITSMAGLASQVTGLAKDIGRLEKQVRDLSTENEKMRQRLDTAQERLSAAIEYISELIRWVESGAHAPAPKPGLIIARDILLPASWLHATTEDPKP